MQVTGPATQRLNLIILGDGYTESEQGKFAADVERNLNVMWSVEPFSSYRNYINIYALSIISGESGVRCDPDEPGGPDPDKLTPLRMIFQQGCVDPLARGTVYNNDTTPGANDPGGPNTALAPGTPTGNQQHNMYLQNYVAPVLGIPFNSQNIQTLAIFNTFTYGGIGGTQATTSGGSPQGPLISLHELGHSLGAMADEYPYSSRNIVKPCYTGGEPGSFHHTIRTSTQSMIDDQFKWWRWMGEESLSGGTIGLHEGGNTFPCGVRRPSEHSIMRWIGFHWDQVGREHMVARITGLRNSGQMPVPSRAAGVVGSDEVLWVDPTQPRNHGLLVTWRIGGPAGDIVDTSNAPFLDLGELAVAPGTIVHVEVRDPVGPDGLDWVRNPSTSNAATNSGYNGSRFVQSRTWTVGEVPVTPSVPGAQITNGSLTNIPLAANDWVYVETNHPTDRAIDVMWELDGNEIANPNNLRNLDLGTLGLNSGTHSLVATASDPAGGDPVTREWTVDSSLPRAPRTLTEPLAVVPDSVEHNVYFGEFEMLLEPQDDEPGFVVGELQLDHDGWFNYFGFPEQPVGTPFKFSHSGTNIKALTYGNLGTGGLSKATFEQSFDESHPSGEFEPGYGTHTVEHRAIDAAGNVSVPGEFRATVLPKSSPACTTTITGMRNGVVNVNSGVTCVDGATLNGGVKVRNGASLVVLKGSTIHGVFTAAGASVVQVFGATVTGDTTISGTTSDVILAGSTFTGSVTLTSNTSSDITILSGETRNYGVIVIGNQIGLDLSCSANTPLVNDFDAPNQVAGSMTGQCAGL
jgi:hypothetical protein